MFYLKVVILYLKGANTLLKVSILLYSNICIPYKHVGSK